MSGNLERALAVIDRVNEEDPRRPHELDYSRWMTEWVRKLAPGASEELILAARAQHVARWRIPREDYPDGRTGYLRWRDALKAMHADLAAGILREQGYGEDSIRKVRALLTHKNLAADPEGQTLEDAACLVFLEREFAEFAAKTDRDKMIEILRKTWGKMSPAARDAALALPLGKREAELVRAALTP